MGSKPLTDAAIRATVEEILTIRDQISLQQQAINEGESNLGNLKNGLANLSRRYVNLQTVLIASTILTPELALPVIPGDQRPAYAKLHSLFVQNEDAPQKGICARTGCEDANPLEPCSRFAICLDFIPGVAKRG